MRKLKVFWSWQSDTPGNIGRHFVREALEVALHELNADTTVVEREEIELDHDRKGVAGSPDLVSTILTKIRESAVFVADVTPVGKGETGRALMNPNVAIELGYALAHIGDSGLLMVLNEAYGDRESLPFDLRHKAGPIIFRLIPNSDREERRGVGRGLAHTLKIALRECLGKKVSSKPTTEVHQETPFRDNRARYFGPTEVLAHAMVRVKSSSCILRGHYSICE